MMESFFIETGRHLDVLFDSRYKIDILCLYSLTEKIFRCDRTCREG